LNIEWNEKAGTAAIFATKKPIGNFTGHCRTDLPSGPCPFKSTAFDFPTINGGHSLFHHIKRVRPGHFHKNAA